ncbi:hypothetical protein AKO1_001786 [Acrasis kona]|uniref:RING-type domain-containing protein n=1 Tax=Acrasis kona TaxID=1008807 RepID=A0AAW2Z8E4_9EUKA
MSEDADGGVCTACCLKEPEPPLLCGHLVCKKCIVDHIDDDTTEYPCPLCSSNKKSLDLPPLDWLEIEGGNHKFIVLVFCRGDWGYFCETIIPELDDVVCSIRNIGGELLCVGKETREIASIAQNVYKPKLFIYGDPKDVVYKELKLEKKAGVTDYLLKLSPRHKQVPNDPHIVIVNRKQRELLFNWLPEQGKFHPQSLTQICLYTPKIRRSNAEYISTNSRTLFQNTLNHNTARNNFYHFTIRGPYKDCVLFMKDVETYESLVGYNSSNHRRSREDVVEEKKLQICSRFLVEGSDHDLFKFLPASMRILYKKILVLDDFKAHCIRVDETRDEYKELTKNGNLFEEPKSFIKELLYNNGFLQFTISDMFVRLLPEIINSTCL